MDYRSQTLCKGEWCLWYPGGSKANEPKVAIVVEQGNASGLNIVAFNENGHTLPHEGVVHISHPNFAKVPPPEHAQLSGAWDYVQLSLKTIERLKEALGLNETYTATTYSHNIDEVVDPDDEPAK